MGADTYSRAGCIIASKSTVRCNPSVFSAADTMIFVSRTSRSDNISASIFSRAPL